ncbi:MAG: nucleoside deaminase [Bacteroidia bacterium]|nr:nucleoside deaminase [Bacteroidia bacterium]MDW8300988.1 nucleoside deaminase [Bacteroidia bacterium]
MNTEQLNFFMRRAIELSRIGMENGQGGPFGAIIVKNNQIIAEGYNQVIATNDPTAHAEIVAIRKACQNLNSFQLNDCILFTSCEPCPMCMGAIYWARPKAVYFANTRKDAAEIGFDDEFIYQELAVPIERRTIPMYQILVPEAKKVFLLWKNKPNKTLY